MHVYYVLMSFLIGISETISYRHRYSGCDIWNDSRFQESRLNVIEPKVSAKLSLTVRLTRIM